MDFLVRQIHEKESAFGTSELWNEVWIFRYAGRWLERIDLAPFIPFQICANDSIGGPLLLCDSSKNSAGLSEIGQNDARAGRNSASVQD